jgi:hypothetical protein
VRQLATAKANLDAAYNTKDPVKIAQAQAAEQAIVDQILAAQATSRPSSPSPSPTK